MAHKCRLKTSATRAGCIALLVLMACSREERQPIEPVASETPPNVVWIVLDACRADRVGWAGYERDTTPNLDRLAERGAVFLNHHTQGLWTELSVPSYMTGRYFPVACVDVMRTYPPRNPPPGELLFPALLGKHGYYTAAFSAHTWIVPESPLARTFDEFHYIPPEPGKPLHAAELETLNKHVLPWLASKTAREPFLLYIHALDTHFPHILDTPDDRWIDPSYESATIKNGIPPQNFGCAFTPQDAELMSALHDGSIHYSDSQIQHVIDALDAEGLTENTIIVVSSDHGDALGEDGTTWGHWESYDEVTQVPLLIAGPGVPAGVRVEAITENVDIVPTLVGLLGIEPDPFAPDGKDLRPLMGGDVDGVRSLAFTKYFNHEYDGAPGFILRSDAFKYERDYGHDVEYLWHLPDRVGQRAAVIEENAAAAAEMRRILEAEYLPAWRAYMDLPKAAVDVFMSPELTGESDIVVIGEGSDAAHDGLWQLLDEVLWHAGWNEDVPPLTLTMTAPRGRYIVQLEVLSTRDHMGHPASAFRVESPLFEPAEFAMAPVDHHAYGFEFRDVGTAEITDGQFTITLDDGDGDYWGALRRVRFVTPYREAEVEEDEVAERIERLKALGYLD